MTISQNEIGQSFLFFQGLKILCFNL